MQRGAKRGLLRAWTVDGQVTNKTRIWQLGWAQTRETMMLDRDNNTFRTRECDRASMRRSQKSHANSYERWKFGTKELMFSDSKRHDR